MFLGIDGGGTKTKFALCDDKGNITAEYTGPTCHYLQCGEDGLASLFSRGIAQVCHAAKAVPDDIAYAFAGCAGYGDVDADKCRIEAAVKVGLGKIRFTVGNDCENALAGALGGKEGINLIAGTGSMGCGMRQGKGIERCGGWHHAIGSDEGSGYWIAWRLIKEFTRQSDGRDEKTPLFNKLSEQLQLSDDGQLITRVVEEWNLDRTRIASLAPLCAELYDVGDAYAITIINDAASELADIAYALYRQLGFSGPVTVSGTGGVFKMGDRIITPLAARLADNNMVFKEPLLPPDCGSLILAMKNYGQSVTDEILCNLAK